MSHWLIGDLAQEHTREIRREAARHQPRATAPTPRPAHRSLRTWLGFTLVEAGLYLIATPATPIPMATPATPNPRR